MSLNTSAFDPDPWLGEWTIFFWATWIAWAPYVGVFIARISRGRTIREFVLGVLLAPSLFTMVWFAVFGAAGIDFDSNSGGSIGEAAANNEAVALFEFLAQYPLALVTSLLAIFLVWIFFVAGADAGTIVLGSMSAGGTPNPKTRIKLTWGAIMALVAAILLLAGGLDAIQQSQILIAAPFGILMLAIAWALLKALRKDYREERQQLQEVMAHDGNVEKQQMVEIMRRHEAGEPIGQSTPGPRQVARKRPLLPRDEGPEVLPGLFAISGEEDETGRRVPW